jgi:hypothetical protein
MCGHRDGKYTSIFACRRHSLLALVIDVEVQHAIRAHSDAHWGHEMRKNEFENSPAVATETTRVRFGKTCETVRVKPLVAKFSEIHNGIQLRVRSFDQGKLERIHRLKRLRFMVQMQPNPSSLVPIIPDLKSPFNTMFR